MRHLKLSTEQLRQCEASEPLRMVYEEIDRTMATDDLRPAQWWEWRRKCWIDGVTTARVVESDRLWRIASALVIDNSRRTEGGEHG